MVLISLLPTQKIRTGRTSVRSAEVSSAFELGLNAEWQRQSQNFLDLGFHIEAGFPDTAEGKQAFLDCLPKFEPQPQEYKGRFDIPLIVIGKKIPWERQAQRAVISISDYLRERIAQTVEWEDNQSKTPDVIAYAGWFNSWGQRFTEKISPFDARGHLKQDEVGGGLNEGIAMQVHYPEFARDNKYFDLIGYNVGSGYVPYLRDWYGRPRLGARWSDDADSSFRPLVRGSKIVTG